MKLNLEKNKPYIEPPHPFNLKVNNPKWAKGYRAIIQYRKTRYMLDARWTPDHGNEVGIVKVNDKGKEIGHWDVFPIKEISEQSLEDFITNFDWETMGGTR